MQLSDNGLTLIKICEDDISPDGSFIVPDGVTHIGNSAFFKCINLHKITMPDSITHIGDSAFSNCINLSQITMADGLVRIGQYAFSKCTSLTQLTLPDSVTYIADFAFSHCTSLKRILMPAGINRIGDYTFFHCTSLCHITIPDGVKHIGDSAFSNCSTLSRITIPDNVTRIDDYAFSNCINIIQITLHDSLLHIGVGALEGCTNVINIVINSDDQEAVAQVKALLPKAHREKVPPMAIIEQVIPIQEATLAIVLEEKKTSPLYRFFLNQTLPELPPELQRHLNTLFPNDNPYYRKVRREIEKVPIPKNDEKLAEYKSTLGGIAQCATEYARESYKELETQRSSAVTVSS